MNILFFDCFSGISGDMALAALLDLDPGNYGYLVSQLKTLGVSGWEITMERRDKNGINANYIKVLTHGHDEHGHGHHHRNFADIIKIIDGGGLTAKAKELSKNIFGRIAAAEAKIHGGDIGSVNFHEVGAVDSIIDITGAAILLDLLIKQNKIEKIYCPAVNDGHGFTQCQHGKIPVPAPATAEILANAQIKTNRIDVPKELATPTGAAIVAEIAGGSGGAPEMAALKIGYGAGTRDLEIPNVLRVILAETDGPGGGETITVIETNIDDCSPEILAYTMEKLLEAGASDVFFTPAYMKKNRPAVKLTVLCKAGAADSLAKIIFTETTTIGVRIREEKRICLAREAKTIKTEYGDLKVKETEFGGDKKTVPEFESAKELAKSAGVPLYKIYGSAERDKP